MMLENKKDTFFQSMKYFEQIIQIRIEYVVTRVREAPGRFGQSHSIPLWDRARFRNRDIIELYIGPGLSRDCWKYVRSSFLGWLVNGQSAGQQDIVRS